MGASNNQVEFTLWLQTRQSALIRAARTICFDSQNAEDVLQEALVDVYERWDKISDHQNLEAYAIRVMVSKHIDMRRKWARRRDEKEVTFDLPEAVLQIADQSDDVVQRLLVQSALKSLTGMQRAVLVLVYEYGLVLREVAEVLQIPAGTVASHLARAKAAVAAHLNLVSEFEKSISNSLSGPKGITDSENIFVYGEVVEDE